MTDITMVGLGGSLTAGSGAGANGVPWFTLTSEYLRKQYLASIVNDVNSGAGGTPSWYGLIRLQSDVLVHNPNIVVVDFAVNDTSGDSAGFSPASEALLRRLMTALPNAKIIPVILCFPDKYSCMTGARRSARNKWIIDCVHYDLSPLRLDLALESIMPVPYTDLHVQNWFPAGCGVHFNAACHALVSVLLHPYLDDLTPNAPVPLPERRIAASADFEYPPMIRTGAQFDSEYGTWYSVGTSRRTITPGSRISFTGVFKSFGLESNNKGRPGIYKWRVDAGDWHAVDLSKTAIHANELAVLAERAAHTVEFESISGALEVDNFMAI